MKDTFEKKDDGTIEVTHLRTESKQDLLDQKLFITKEIGSLQDNLANVNAKLDLLNEDN